MRVAILAGGQTAEAQGTMGSATMLAEAANSAGFDAEILALPGEAESSNRLRFLVDSADYDVAFPLIPGLEGTLELIGVPFAGSSPMAAGISAHKGIFNDLVSHAGFRKVPYAYGEARQVANEWMTNSPHFPAFVKPARLGASYGITRVTNESELTEAVTHASIFDKIVVVEESVPKPFEEFEVALILGATTQAGAARIQAAEKVWRDTGSKYSIDTEVLPVRDDALAARLIEAATDVAELTGVTCACRVDLFVGEEGDPYVGEINALPGQGAASTFPRILEMTVASRPEQVGMMIEAALANHARRTVEVHAF